MNLQVAVPLRNSLRQRAIEHRLRVSWRSLIDEPVVAQLVLAADRRVAHFNQRYRAKAGPTDVLTFVYARGPAGIHGDIVIASGVARRQARARGVTYREELLRLCIHGLAHLAGYDHGTRQEFSCMRKKEFETLIQIL